MRKLTNYAKFAACLYFGFSLNANAIEPKLDPELNKINKTNEEVIKKYDTETPEINKILTISEKDQFIGKRDAPVKMFIYSCFSCPHCFSFEFEILPQLIKKYVENEKLAVVFRNFPMDYKSLKGSMLGRCMKNPLIYRKEAFAAIQSDIRSNVPGSDLSSLKKLAAISGIGDIAYVKCIEDEKALNQLISEKYLAVKVLGIGATPVFFINGTKYEGLMPFANFEYAINKEIDRPQATKPTNR